MLPSCGRYSSKFFSLSSHTRRQHETRHPLQPNTRSSRQYSCPSENQATNLVQNCLPPLNFPWTPNELQLGQIPLAPSLRVIQRLLKRGTRNSVKARRAMKNHIHATPGYRSRQRGKTISPISHTHIRECRTSASRGAAAIGRTPNRRRSSPVGASCHAHTTYHLVKKGPDWYCRPHFVSLSHSQLDRGLDDRLSATLDPECCSPSSTIRSEATRSPRTPGRRVFFRSTSSQKRKAPSAKNATRHGSHHTQGGVGSHTLPGTKLFADDVGTWHTSRLGTADFGRGGRGSERCLMITWCREMLSLSAQTDIESILSSSVSAQGIFGYDTTPRMSRENVHYSWSVKTPASYGGKKVWELLRVAILARSFARYQSPPSVRVSGKTPGCLPMGPKAPPPSLVEGDIYDNLQEF